MGVARMDDELCGGMEENDFRGGLVWVLSCCNFFPVVAVSGGHDSVPIPTCYVCGCYWCGTQL